MKLTDLFGDHLKHVLSGILGAVTAAELRPVLRMQLKNHTSENGWVDLGKCGRELVTAAKTRDDAAAADALAELLGQFRPF